MVEKAGLLFSPTRLDHLALRLIPLRVGENHPMQRGVAAVREGQNLSQVCFAQEISRYSAKVGVGAMLQSRTPLFDFTTERGRTGWGGLPMHDIARVVPGTEGLTIHSSGSDPYLFGPPVVMPVRIPLWLVLRLRASDSGTGQVFYWPDGSGPTEANSVRFPVRPNRWETVRIPLPLLPEAPTYRFRIDPPGGAGAVVTVALLDVELRVVLPEPAWPRPPLPDVPLGSASVWSGEMQVLQGQGWGDLRVLVAGELFAVGNPRPLIGYQTAPDAPLQWLDVAQVGGQTRVHAVLGSMRVEARFKDADSGTWTLTQTFRAVKGGVEVEARVSASVDRIVAYLPWLTLLPGSGSFGTDKTQALFAGLEYLDKNEPSSSEADVRGPGALRHVPDSYQITLPLMALAARGRWLSVAWEPSPLLAAAFDSPDRRFNSGGHLLSLLFPGTEGRNARPAGSLLPHAGLLLRAKETLAIRATISGGIGDTVAPAIQSYVARRGLPPVPKTDPETTARTFATGWLDSGVRKGDGRYRHAYPGDFSPQPAADAAVCLAWLATQISLTKSMVSSRLIDTALEAWRAVPADDLPVAAVGHVRPFAAPLWFSDPGSIADHVYRMVKEARTQLARFDSDGSIPYHPAPGKTDLGTTHFASHANGLTAEVLARVLDAARLTGVPELAGEGLRRLGQTAALYQNSVPRGAQTWEVPLHTPDILASAHLVRAFVRGYELTGDHGFLTSAIYWAWTGVPFVYLVRPTSEPVGIYGTIAVYGATQWESPLWIGMPVQWCGLVYADALYDLAVWDTSGPWKQLADGIVASGIAQTWPVGSNRERQGLLPDSFNLSGQVRNDVAINPATLQIPYARSVSRPVYDCCVVQFGGPFVHAPGRIRSNGKFDPRVLSFTVENEMKYEYTVIVSGLTLNVPPFPTVLVNGKPAKQKGFSNGTLAFSARGRSRIEIRDKNNRPLRV